MLVSVHFLFAKWFTNNKRTFHNFSPQCFDHRIQAKTRELRERQAKEREYAEIQDVVGHTFSSDEEHTYAGIGSLDSSVDSSNVDHYNQIYHLPQSGQSPHLSSSLQDNGPPLEALYAQVNKPRNGRPASSDRWGASERLVYIRALQQSSSFTPHL